MLTIRYAEIAAEQLKAIAAFDKKSAGMVLSKIEQYALNPASFKVKTLKGRFVSFKWIRAGDYRIIFDDNNNVMNVYQVKHRKEAYK